MATAYKINGMTCNHCKANVEKNLAKVPGVTSVQVDLEKALAYVEGKPSDNDIKNLVDELGYEYKGKE
jgi:copper chaperone CopZ